MPDGKEWHESLFSSRRGYIWHRQHESKTQLSQMHVCFFTCFFFNTTNTDN